MSRMIQHCRALAIGAAASVLVLIAPAAAEPAYRLAQVYPVYPSEAPRALRRQHADALVRSLGLRPIGPVERHGPVFIIDAVGQEGTPVEVTLDRRSGRVLAITRLGRGAPRLARAAPQPGYGPDDDDEAGFRDDVELPPGAPRYEPEYRGAPADGPRVITRDPDVTNSIPRTAPPRSADPMQGVPKEFRGRAAPDREEQRQPRLAARPPAEAPRAAPLPRPRPTDAPAVAQKDPVAPPAAKPQPSPAAKPKPDPDDVPDAQGFE